MMMLVNTRMGVALLALFATSSLASAKKNDDRMTRKRHLRKQMAGSNTKKHLVTRKNRKQNNDNDVDITEDVAFWTRSLQSSFPPPPTPPRPPTPDVPPPAVSTAIPTYVVDPTDPPVPGGATDPPVPVPPPGGAVSTPIPTYVVDDSTDPPVPVPSTDPPVPSPTPPSGNGKLYLVL